MPTKGNSSSRQKSPLELCGGFGTKIKRPRVLGKRLLDISIL
jgi:hypothetical protein